MSTSKQQYLDSIRDNTSYPVYRKFITVISFMMRLSAIGGGLVAVISGFAGMRYSFWGGAGTLVLGLVGAAVAYLLAIVFKEASLILADLGDSTVEANSRPAERTPAAAVA